MSNSSSKIQTDRYESVGPGKAGIQRFTFTLDARLRGHDRGRTAGFSLTEMLIATGIMAIGLVMVATIFPVGMKLTALSAERSVAAVTSDEAFAKIQLYGLRDFQTGTANNWPVPDPNIACSDFRYVNNLDLDADGTLDILAPGWDEFIYPSAAVPAGQERNYHWSALCRRKIDEGDKMVQVTVFVTRRIAAVTRYYGYDPAGPTVVSNLSWPVPVKVDLRRVGSKTLEIDTAGVWGNTALTFFDEGYTIVDDQTGSKYRILEMKDVYPPGGDGNLDIILQNDWAGDVASPPGYPVATQTWVIPPGFGSSRYPCVGIFQRVIPFDEIE